MNHAGVARLDIQELNDVGKRAYNSIISAIPTLDRNSIGYSDMFQLLYGNYHLMILATPRTSLTYRFGAFDTGVEFLALHAPAAIVDNQGLFLKHYWRIPLGAVMVEDYINWGDIPPQLGFRPKSDWICHRKVSLLGFDLRPRNLEPMTCLIVYNHLTRSGVVVVPIGPTSFQPVPLQQNTLTPETERAVISGRAAVPSIEGIDNSGSAVATSTVISVETSGPSTITTVGATTIVGLREALCVTGPSRITLPYDQESDRETNGTNGTNGINRIMNGTINGTSNGTRRRNS